MPDMRFATVEEVIHINRIIEKMVRSVEGEPMTLVALASLQLACGLWAMGGSSREQIETMCLFIVDRMCQGVAKPN